MTPDETTQRMCRFSNWRGFKEKVEAKTMSEYTKGEQEFLNILMNVWVNGWYSGTAGDRTDNKKRIDCPRIMARYPVQAAAPQLLEACELLLGAYTNWVQKYEPATYKNNVVIAKGEAAIVAAKG